MTPKPVDLPPPNCGQKHNEAREARRQEFAATPPSRTTPKPPPAKLQLTWVRNPKAKMVSMSLQSYMEASFSFSSDCTNTAGA